MTPEAETKVHICTIQGLVKRVLYAADDAEAPPVDQYDLMVVDECHRGYLLDREMSDAELSFRGQEDYISKYRRVLEYFDAVKIGLTATPALHTTDIFGDPIFTYSYREAVIDGYLIDHEPPMRIETALARARHRVREGRAARPSEHADRRDRSGPRARRNPLRGRSVQQAGRHRRVQPRRRRGTGEPHRPDAPGAGKTLIFAATDAHADIVVSADQEGLRRQSTARSTTRRSRRSPAAWTGCGT